MFKANLIAGAEFDAAGINATNKNRATLATVVAWSTFIGIILYNKFVMGTVLHHFTDL